MTMRTVIDTHLHLSPQVSPSALVAATALENDLAASNVERAIVLHLLAQPWSAEEFAEAISTTKRLSGFINLDPFDSDAQHQLREGVEKLGFIGLKLHPRLQKFDLDDPAVRRLVGYAGEINVPVLIDAFPDGDWLMMGFDPIAFARLAKACRLTRIIIGHFGGHHCLDFMMLAKRLPNVWFDLSYSLLYYEGSAVTANLLYCCRSMKYQRIFYGSDYPDRDIATTIRRSLGIFEAHGVNGVELDQLMRSNALEFFGWADRI
jgi:predicted TIM-barrel fold metal-dependent hydrolase